LSYNINYHNTCLVMLPKEKLQMSVDENHINSTSGSVLEVAALFLRLGIVAFGGPAAHIAMFREEFVSRRKWLSDEEFLDMLGATNMIPGPNSTEMAIHIGYKRSGYLGLIVAGVSFILPAMLIVLVLAMLYVEYGSLPAAGWLLYGIKPVIIAVIVQAIWGLVEKAVKNYVLAIIGLAVFVLYLLGGNEILLLFAGGIVYMLIRRIQENLKSKNSFGFWFFPLAQLLPQTLIPVSLDGLFWTFLKIGSVLYGSGYVLLAFLRNDFVERLGWLTNQQLLDAVAIGQFTPGPVFTTATFIGYLIGGFSGAILATIGIFLPSFVFVALSQPLIPRLRQSRLFSALLDGVNIAALGLMAAVLISLAQDALVDWMTLTLAFIAGILLLRYKINSTWLIIGGGVIGILYKLVVG
jgi:chromate transporter